MGRDIPGRSTEVRETRTLIGVTALLDHGVLEAAWWKTRCGQTTNVLAHHSEAFGLYPDQENDISRFLIRKIILAAMWKMDCKELGGVGG